MIGLQRRFGLEDQYSENGAFSLAHFLIAGTMAWDRPLFLNRPLSPGGRAQAMGQLGDALTLPEGRLGGGGANAAAALINAGHQATVASAVTIGSVGDQILEAANETGINTSFVQRTDFGERATLVLVDPNGERFILGMQDSADRTKTKLPAVLKAFEDALAAAQAKSSYDGLFLRTGDALNSERLQDFKGPVLTHGPIARAMPTDYVVASSDDLKAAGHQTGGAFDEIARLVGARLKAVIVTAGEQGGAAYTSDSEISYQTPKVQQVDSTGAGDCFAAGFLEATVSGANLRDALNHGAHWGAETASRRGSALRSEETIYPAYQTQIDRG